MYDDASIVDVSINDILSDPDVPTGGYVFIYERISSSGNFDASQ